MYIYADILENKKKWGSIKCLNIEELRYGRIIYNIYICRQRHRDRDRNPNSLSNNNNNNNNNNNSFHLLVRSRFYKHKREVFGIKVKFTSVFTSDLKVLQKIKNIGRWLPFWKSSQVSKTPNRLSAVCMGMNCPRTRYPLEGLNASTLCS